MAQASGPVDWAAFEQGLATAADERNGGLLTAIFSARTLGLTHKLAPAQLPDYLSGLLIGHEITGMQRMQGIQPGVPGAPLLLVVLPCCEPGPLKAGSELASCISRFCPSWKLK